MLLVHDVRQAADTIASAQAEGAPLVVAYGNDHVAGVNDDDGVVQVDAGTAGASGYEAIGARPPPSPLSPALEPPALRATSTRTSSSTSRARLRRSWSGDDA